ncbi:hypothetical protein [Herpetosiphon llansteffanensis]|uniref:hypothetical protein n=1 Tax=Herpetosiphon llansteffanensis TaxID=2094568 RepID=UPI000D7C5637|nr:hypothetical protein [Herpetosiphon llansteffanensis]
MDGLNKPHSRRKFLASSGLAAVAASSLLGDQAPAAATASSSPTMLDQMALPPSAKMSIRCLRALTLLTMSTKLTDQEFSAEVYAVGLKDFTTNLQALVGRGTSDLVSYRPNPEESLPARPWWWPKRRFRLYAGQIPSHEPIPEAGGLVLDLLRSLDSYNIAFYSDQLEFAELSQHLALAELQSQTQRLIDAQSLAGLYPGDDICPWWWPIPRPNWWVDLAENGFAVPPIPIPPCDLRELAMNLQRGLLQMAVAERYSDSERGAYRLDTLRPFIHAGANQLAAYAGTLTGWLAEDMLDRPPPLPYFETDNLLDELDGLVDRPPPQPYRLNLADQIMQALQIVGVACHIRNKQLAGRLQTAALNQIKDLAYQI